MSIEKIIDTKCLDVYRVSSGVLLKVYKCKIISHMYSGFNKRKHEKIAENIYVTKEEITLRGFQCSNVIPIGSHIVENDWVEPINNYKEFRFEVKTTSNSFSGNLERMNQFLTAIDTILADYIN